MRIWSTRARRLTTCVIAAIAAVTLSGATATAAPSYLSSTDGDELASHRTVLIVDGAVAHRQRLSTTDLTALPQQTITVTFQSGSGAQTHTYTGPLLLDVLNGAQPTFDPAVKNDKLRYAVTATGSDRYQAAVAWAEFDPDFAGKTILVAVTEDGQPLADGRPRLVVPGDLKGGRYVSMLVRLRLSR